MKVKLGYNGRDKARLFISIRHAPLVAIQFTKNIEHWFVPQMLELFGEKFLSGVYKTKGLIYSDFEASEEEIHILSELLKKMAEQKKTEVDIDLNMN